MILTIRKSRVIDLCSIFLIYFAALVSLNEALNVLALYGAIPVAFLLSFISNGNSLKKDRYLQIMLVLFVWIGLTYFSAFDYFLAARELKQILGVFLLCYTISNLSNNEENVPYLYFVYLLYYLGLIYYAYENFISLGFDIANERVDDKNLNANTLAYFTFYTTFTIFILGFILKNKLISSFFKYLFFGMIIMSFYIAIYTASRQVLIIQIPLILLLLYIRYFKKVTNKKRFIIIGIIAIGGIYLLPKASDVYNQSYLKERSEQNLKKDNRGRLFVEAIEVGCEHPLIGVGPGNFLNFSFNKHFSHCTYAELFANSGIFAMLLYLYLVLRYIVKQINRYRKSKDKMYLVFLSFGFIFFIDNFFFVFYTGLWLMSFFILVACHSDMYFNDSNKVKLIRVH